MLGSSSSVLDPILASRGNLDSYGRTGALHASGALIAEHPLIGWGVNVSRFSWDTPDAGASVALYAHNEYLQTLVDLGLIGAVALLAVLVALAWIIWRGRPTTSAREDRTDARGLWAGATAAVACLAVHSGFDFLWHLALLPLLGGLLVGLAAPVPARHVPRGEPTIPCGPDEIRPALEEEFVK
jgi:O-antigen ligase